MYVETSYIIEHLRRISFPGFVFELYLDFFCTSIRHILAGSHPSTGFYNASTNLIVDAFHITHIRIRWTRINYERKQYGKLNRMYLMPYSVQRKLRSLSS